MPTVPYNPVPTERLTGQATPELRVPNVPAAFGGNVAEATAGLGRTLEKTGDEIFSRAIWLQHRANEVEANDLFIQADIAAGQLKMKYNSLEGKAAVEALPKYQQDLDDIRKDYLGRASNSDIARTFDKDFKRRVGYMITDGGTYAAGQNKKYNNSVYDSRLKLSVSDAASAPEDDIRFKASLEAARTAARDKARENGLEPEFAEREAVTQVWGAKLLSMAKNDPLRARELFNQHRGELDGIQALSIQDKINQNIVTVQSRIDSQRIMAGYGALSEEYVDRIKKFEGYNPNPYSDVKQTSSGYGTKFVPGDERYTPEELKSVHDSRARIALGRAANVVDNVNSTLPEGLRASLISLTYNTGEGWTTAGLGQAIKRGDFESARNLFLQYNNVNGSPNSAISKRREQELSWWGEGETKERGPMTAASAASRMQEADEEVKNVAAKIFPDDPGNQAAYEAMLRSRVQTEFNQMKSTVNMQKQANWTYVMTEVSNPDSAKAPKKFEEMSAQAQEAYYQLDPTRQKQVRNQLDKNAKGDVPETPERIFRYSQIMEQALKDPTYLKSVDILDLDLTNAQKKKLLDKDRGQAVDAQDEVNNIRAMHSVQPMLNDLGIYASKTDKEANRKYELVGGLLAVQMKEYKEQFRKDMPQDEINKRVLQIVDTRQGSGGWFSRAKPNYEIPADIRKQLLEAFKAKGINPSEQNIMDAWFRYNKGKSQ